MKAQALNCPNCGAAVSSDRTQCQFCKSRLKTVGCPVCLKVMFLGSKFCTHCGSKAAAAEVVTPEKAGECPRCRNALQLLNIGRVNIRECEKCGGFWSDPETFEQLCSSTEDQAAVLGFIKSDSHPHAHPETIRYVPCPDCAQLMNRSNFARSSGVIVDMCRSHGVWFDADELPRIIDFIGRGGMAKQREKEKIEIRSEISRLREEQRKLALMERRSGLGAESGKTSGIGGFLKFLFDE